MKTLSAIISHTNKDESLESSRERYPTGNRTGKSARIDEVSDTLGWDRTHTIKALKRKSPTAKKPRGEDPSPAT
jgi:hypothetical protein